MKQFCLIMVLGLISTCAVAQNKSGDSPELPKGSVLRVTFSDPLEAAKSKIGDPVRFYVLGLVDGGGLKRPRQTLTLVGHITEVRLHTDEKSESRLGVAFDKILIGNPTDNPRELPVGALITRIVTEEESMMDRNSKIPTSGDDPVQRAAGPVVDNTGRLAYSHPPLDRPAPAGRQGVYDQKVKDITLLADDSTNVTVIVCKKRNIVMEPGMRLIVRVTSSGK